MANNYSRLVISSDKEMKVSLPDSTNSLCTVSALISNLEYPWTPLLCLQLPGTISYSFLLYQATSNGCLVSGPVDFEIVLEIWTGGNRCYIIIPFSDEICSYNICYFQACYCNFSYLKECICVSCYWFSNFEFDTHKIINNLQVALIYERYKGYL